MNLKNVEKIFEGLRTNVMQEGKELDEEIINDIEAIKKYFPNSAKALAKVNSDLVKAGKHGVEWMYSEDFHLRNGTVLVLSIVSLGLFEFSEKSFLKIIAKIIDSRSKEVLNDIGEFYTDVTNWKKDEKQLKEKYSIRNRTIDMRIYRDGKED